MKRKFLSLVLSALMLFAAVTPAFAEGEAFDSFGAYKHVFIIGVDGCGAAWSEVNSPNFDRIFVDDNAWRYNAIPEYETTSAQNWGSILTGVAYDVHGFKNDTAADYERDSSSGNNSIFYYARQEFPESELVSFNHWTAINHGIIENDINVKKINRGTDPLVVQAIETYLNAGNEPTVLFCQLDSVDHAAHTYGGFSKQYYNAAEKADEYLGKIYDAVEANGFMDDSLFIVVADHGETANGHGGRTAEEASAVLAVAGRSVNAGELDETVRNRDVAAIALYALGIEKPAHMTAELPDGLFGEEREKTTAPNPMSCFAKFWQDFAYFFVRMVNALVSIFDGSGIY